MHRLIIAAILVGSAFGTWATYDANPRICPAGEELVTFWARDRHGKPYQDVTKCDKQALDAIVFVRNADGKIARQKP